MVVCTKSAPSHPSAIWQREVRQITGSLQLQLRLAAMAGHMAVDKIAARRAALIDLLADGRSHPREALWSAVEKQLGKGCWGKRPHETLARDLAVLRKGGIRIAYSRRPGLTGYYLQYPPLSSPASRPFESTNWPLVKAIGQMAVPEKNERAFAAADFALIQKRLIMAEEHPAWPEEQVDRKARRLVFGVSEELLP